MSRTDDTGLVGILATDRDADLVPAALQHLGHALARIDGVAVDLVMSLRAVDRRAKMQAIAHAPRRLRRLDVEVGNYEAEWTGAHTSSTLDAVCRQRNEVVRRAREGGYAWLLFLDSDVMLEETTLVRLLAASGDVIHAPYRPRWAAQPIVGVPGNDADDVELLVNPHLYETSAPSFAAAVVAGGCTLLRRSAFDVPFEIADLLTIRGEDIGFSRNALQRGLSIQCLSRHFVEHRCRAASTLLLPSIDDTRALRLQQREVLLRMATQT